MATSKQRLNNIYVSWEIIERLRQIYKTTTRTNNSSEVFSFHRERIHVSPDDGNSVVFLEFSCRPLEDVWTGAITISIQVGEHQE